MKASEALSYGIALLLIGGILFVLQGLYVAVTTVSEGTAYRVVLSTQYECGRLGTTSACTFLYYSMIGAATMLSFVENTMEGYRSLKISDIKGKLIRRFGEKYKELFDEMIKGTEGAVRYDTIISNRHSTAHGEPANLTFDELVESYKKAESVITAISNAINSS